MDSINNLFVANLGCSYNNFEKNFKSIIEKFTKLANQGRHTDEVDIETLEIVVDKGFLKDSKKKSFGKSSLASEHDTKSQTNTDKDESQTNHFTAFGSNMANRPCNLKEIFGTNNDFENDFHNSMDLDKSLNYEGVIHKKLIYEDIKLDDLLEPSDAESISSSFSEDSNEDDESDIDSPLPDSLHHNTSLDLKSSSSVASLSVKDDNTSKLSNDDLVINRKVIDGDRHELCQEATSITSVNTSSNEITLRNSTNQSSTNNNIILENEDSVNAYTEHSLVDGVLDLRCHKTPNKPDVVISSNDIEKCSALKQCVIEKPMNRMTTVLHLPTLNSSSLLKDDLRGTLNLDAKNSPEELIKPIRPVNRCDAGVQLKENHIRNLQQKDLDSKKIVKMPLSQGSRFKCSVFDPCLNETFKIDSTCGCKMHSEICLKMIPNLDLLNCKNDVSPITDQAKSNKSNLNETFLVNKCNGIAQNTDNMAVPNIDSTRELPLEHDFSSAVLKGNKVPSQMSQVLWNSIMGNRNNVSNYRCIDGQCVPVDLKMPHEFSHLADTVVESEHFIGFVLPKFPQISFKGAPSVTTQSIENVALYSETQIAHKKTGRSNSILDSCFYECDASAQFNKNLGVCKVSKANIHPRNELEVRNRNTPENYFGTDDYTAFKPPPDIGKQIESDLIELSPSKKLLENKEAFSIARRKFLRTRSSFEGTRSTTSIKLSDGLVTNAARNVNQAFTTFTDAEQIRNTGSDIIKPQASDVMMQPKLSSIIGKFDGGGCSRKLIYDQEIKKMPETFKEIDPKSAINKSSTLLVNRKKSRKKSMINDSKPCVDIRDTIETCSLLHGLSDESDIDSTAAKLSIGDMVRKKEALQNRPQRYFSLEKYEDPLMSTLENSSVIQCASKNIFKRKMEFESDSADDVFDISNYSDSLYQVSKSLKHDIPVGHSRKKLDRVDRKCSYKTRARMNNKKGEVNSGLERKAPTSKLHFANDFNDALGPTGKQTYSRASQPRKKKLMVANHI